MSKRDRKPNTVQPGETSIRIMPWWWAIIATATSILLGAGAWFIVWSIAKHDANLRIEAIKVGLSVIAGVGAASALLLAFRRQIHNEYVARDNVLDATQRRVTELFAKSVEQLGNDKAAVRLGGLYALERLGQENPDHRQTVTDVICAYLRMPYSPASWNNAGSSTETLNTDTSQQELLVRAAAQQMLARHLEDPELSTTSIFYWEKMRVDLRGAYLDNVVFSSCKFWIVEFNQAIFNGEAWFDQTSFDGWCECVGVRFNGAVRFGSDFNGPADFSQTNFTKAVSFDDATFLNDAVFDNTHFDGAGKFRNAKFRGVTSFEHSHFGDAADFRGAYFAGTSFEDAQFASTPDFTGATATVRPYRPSDWPDNWTAVLSDDEEETLRLVRTAGTAGAPGGEGDQSASTEDQRRPSG